MTLVFMIAESNRLPERFRNPASGSIGASNARMTSRSSVNRPSQFSRMVRPLTVGASGCGSAPAARSSATTAGMPPARKKSSPRNRPAGWRSTSSGMWWPDALPVVVVEGHADVGRDRVVVDGRVGRAADGRADRDHVLEGLAGHDVGRLQVLAHHVHDALAGQVGDLAAIPVHRRDDRRAGQHHAQRLGQRVHRGRGAHRVAEAGRRRRRRDHVDVLGPVDLARRLELLGVPLDGARSPSARPCTSR